MQSLLERVVFALSKNMKSKKIVFAIAHSNEQPPNKERNTSNGLNVYDIYVTYHKFYISSSFFQVCACKFLFTLLTLQNVFHHY